MFAILLAEANEVAAGTNRLVSREAQQTTTSAAGWAGIAGQAFITCITGQALLRGTALTRLAATPGALTIAAVDGSEEILCYADEVVTTAATQLVRVSVA